MNIWLSPVGTKWEVRAKMIKLLIKSWQFGAIIPEFIVGFLHWLLETVVETCRDCTIS